MLRERDGTRGWKNNKVGTWAETKFEIAGSTLYSPNIRNSYSKTYKRLKMLTVTN